MGVKLQSALGGSVELNAPSTASHFTMNVPAMAGTLVAANTSGNVGIGTDAPQGRLTVQGGSFTQATISQVRTGAGQWHKIVSVEGNLLFREGDIIGTNDYLTITSAGALILSGSTAQKATGTTWSNPSDERLKDNIRDYGKGIAELMQVRVREWEYNGKGGTVEGTKGLGVVADEVMVVLPDTVENYDAKLNVDDEDVTAIKKFDATEITWLLVKTVQEQQIIINDLKYRLEVLENN